VYLLKHNYYSITNLINDRIKNYLEVRELVDLIAKRHEEINALMEDFGIKSLFWFELLSILLYSLNSNVLDIILVGQPCGFLSSS
jgi:hypothetical protein